MVLTAAALEGAEREAFLDRVAAAEPEVASEARRRLLAADVATESFLGVPAAARLEGAAASARVPTRPASPTPAERYDLGECLGRGGMGRVVLAFDRQLGRSVALKFLVHRDPAVARAFLREARAQARVRHPHVLDVYDSGELDGQPFISMRHVAGGTLAKRAAELPLELKVRLLAQVAEGLHAAHREGLLHRDVKPSNVLIEETPDGELVALVADFGVAAELDDAGSIAHAAAGSPAYMAPERLLGTAAVDRRSDVYSLGVTLYQVLTGELPFQGENTVEVLRGVLRQEPAPPRQHAPSLPPELEAIVLRCMASDPDHRYASARAVAADLQRFLAGEVVEAYAAGLAYRATRFVLRHKLLAGVVAAATALLLVASAAVAVFALRAEAARRRAEARQGQAEELVRFMVVDLYEKLDSVGRLDVLDEVGDAATEYFRAVPEEDLSEAELLGRSRTLYQIGDVRIRQGDLAGAAAPMEESLALARRLADLAPDDGERLFALGQSHFWVGFVRWRQGDLEAARGPFEEYLDISRRLVAEDPGNLDWRRELGYAHSNLGSLLQAEGDLEEALAEFRATLEIDEALTAADPSDHDGRSELAATHNLIGVLLQDLGRPQAADRHLETELAIRRELLAVEPADPRTRELLGTCHSHLGILRSTLGDWPGSGRHFEAARAIFTELAAHDPANASWQYKLAWSHLHLGRAAFARGEAATADREWRRQREILDAALDGEEPHDWRRTRAIGLYHLALLRGSRGEADRAGLRTAIEILEELARARPTDRPVHRWLSQSHLLLGSLEDSPAAAAAAFERAETAIGRFARGSRDSRLVIPWAAALRCLGRRDEAMAAEDALGSGAGSEPVLSDLCRPMPATDGSAAGT